MPPRAAAADDEPRGLPRVAPFTFSDGDGPWAVWWANIAFVTQGWQEANRVQFARAAIQGNAMSALQAMYPAELAGLNFEQLGVAAGRIFSVAMAADEVVAAFASVRLGGDGDVERYIAAFIALLGRAGAAAVDAGDAVAYFVNGLALFPMGQMLVRNAAPGTLIAAITLARANRAFLAPGPGVAAMMVQPVHAPATDGGATAVAGVRRMPQGRGGGRGGGRGHKEPFLDKFASCHPRKTGFESLFFSNFIFSNFEVRGLSPRFHCE